MALLLPAPTRTLLHLLSLRCRSKSTAGADTNTMLSVFRSMLHLRGAKGHDAERLMAEYLATDDSAAAERMWDSIIERYMKEHVYTAMHDFVIKVRDLTANTGSAFRMLMQERRQDLAEALKMGCWDEMKNLPLLRTRAQYIC